MRLRYGAGDETWLSPLGLILVTVACATFILFPLHRTADYPLWDEANYLGWGRDFWTTGSLGGIVGSPLYLLWYAGWTKLLPEGGGAVFATHYALKVSLVVLVAMLARHWTRSTWAGLCAGVATGMSVWNIMFPMLVYHGAFVLFLCAVLAADRRPFLAGAFLLLAVLVRLDYVFALMSFVAMAIFITVMSRSFQFWKNGSLRMKMREVLPLVPLLMLNFFVLAHVNNWKIGTDRSWFAFRQHYAAGLVARGEITGLNPWVEYSKVVERDFRDASSLRDAWKANPRAVFVHVADNLRRFPGEIALITRSSYHDGLAELVGWGLSVAVLLAGACAKAEKRTCLKAWLAEHRWSLAVAACGMPVVLPGLIVYAKTAYLLPVLPFVWALGAAGAMLLRSRMSGFRFGGQATPVVALALLALVVFFAERPFRAIPPSRPVYETVQILLRECRKPARILGVSASSYASLLGEGWQGIEPLASVAGHSSGKAKGLTAMIDSTQSNAVLVTSAWRTLSSFDEAPFKALEESGWRVVPLREGTLYLAPER